MTVNNCAVGFNMPAAIKDTGDDLHDLPPRRIRKAFLVDEHPACPEHWLRSSGRIKSYFVPIIEDHGMWLDFNESMAMTEYDVAIVVSVQGVNAITGLPCKDPQLEQYRDECPKHKKAFGPDRFCKECNYKWPKQNYIASTATPEGFLWLDGFRSDDGVVRQYVLTASVLRSVAKAIVGNDRVYALGVSFFLSKQKRPKPVIPPSRGVAMAGGLTWGSSVNHYYSKGLDGSVGSVGPEGLVGYDGDTSAVNFMADAECDKISISMKNSPGISTHEIDRSESKRSLMDTGRKGALMRSVSAKSAKLSFAPSPEPMATASLPIKKLASTKAMEIAAGAKIDQRVYDDANGLDFYQDTPEGIIVVNYCLESEADAIVKAGKVDVSGSKDGFLKDVPIGNP